MLKSEGFGFYFCTVWFDKINDSREVYDDRSLNLESLYHTLAFAINLHTRQCDR